MTVKMISQTLTQTNKVFSFARYVLVSTQMSDALERLFPKASHWTTEPSSFDKDWSTSKYRKIGGTRSVERIYLRINLIMYLSPSRSVKCAIRIRLTVGIHSSNHPCYVVPTRSLLDWCPRPLPTFCMNDTEKQEIRPGRAITSFL